MVKPTTANSSSDYLKNSGNFFNIIQNDLVSNLEADVLHGSQIGFGFQDLVIEIGNDLRNKSFYYSWPVVGHIRHPSIDKFNLVSGKKILGADLDKADWTNIFNYAPKASRSQKLAASSNQVYAFTLKVPRGETLGVGSFSDLFTTTRSLLGKSQNNFDTSPSLAASNSAQTSLDFQDLTAEIGRGFGDSENRYSWSVIEHNDSLFVGTLNLTNGGEVWRTSLDQTDWTKVLDFGTQVDGVRELVTYQNQIYAFTTGFRITEPSGFVSSDNGESWSEITGGPLESRINESVRTSIVYNGLLYVGTFDSSGAEVWTFNGTSWNIIKKFSSEIEEISSFIEFEDKLYVGVWNQGSYFFTGDTFDIDVTPSFGGRRFESNNGGVIDTVIFQDQLYLSTWNFINGFSLFRTADPLTGQWEIVTSNGFSDRNNAYGWSMAVYDDPVTTVEGDELYLGTFNTGLYDSNNQPFDGLAKLYSTSDGDNWQQVSLPDFGQFTWGIRNLVVTTSDKLLLGTATNYLVPEGDEVGTQVWIADL
jgi:hypothetical protein